MKTVSRVKFNCKHVHIPFCLLTAILCTLTWFSCSVQPEPELVDLSVLELSNLPYRFNKELQGDRHSNANWIDTNDDGISEQLVIENDPIAPLSLILYGMDARGWMDSGVWQQYNEPGAKMLMVFLQPFLFADLDDDNEKEFIFSFIRGDTTYLKVLDHDFQTPLYQLPVASAVQGFGRKGKREYAVIAEPQVLYDIDKNGSLDILCTFYSGFSPTPRGVYAFDLRTGRLLKSYRMPWNPTPMFNYDHRSFWFEDLNGDGDPELMPVYMYAVDNGVKVNGLDDSHSYLFVLNSQLEPLYVEDMGGKFSRVVAFPVRTPEGLRLLTVSSSLYLQEHNTSELRLYNPNSFLVERNVTIPLPLQFTGATGLIVDDVTGDGQPNYIVGTETGKLYLFNWNLEVLNTQQFSKRLQPRLAVDLNGDGLKEVLCNAQPGGLLVLDREFKVLALEPEIADIQLLEVGRGKPPKLMVADLNDQNFLLTYRRNLASQFDRIAWGLAGAVIFGLSGLAFLWFSQASKERRNRALLLDSVTAGILHIDHSGSVLTCNQQACRFLSVPEKQLQRQNLYQLVREANLSNRELFTRFVEMHENRFEGKEIHDLQTSEGLRRIALTSKCILSTSGKFAGLLISLWDETTALEYERTLSWASMAQRMAHEIKSPLSTIALTAQRLQMQYRKDRVTNQSQYDAYVQSLLEETRRMQQIAKGFMQFVNLEKPNKTPLNLTGFFAEMRQDIRDRLPSKIDFNLELQNPLPYIAADPSLIKLALNNIIENAVDAMKREGILSIKVETAQHLHNGHGKNNLLNTVCIEITDTGAGIPQDKQAEIFKPYFSTKSTGTGLGLAISKKIVEDHGGALYLSSREGHGTSVYLYWPTAD